LLDLFFQQQHVGYIDKIHKKYCGLKTGLTFDDFRSALHECGVRLSPEDQALVFKRADLDEGGGQRLQEFRTAVRTPTRLEQWVSTLPLTRLLAHCLGLRVGDSEDPLRVLSKLSRGDLKEAVAVCCEGLERILADAQMQLRKSLDAMNEAKADSSARRAVDLRATTGTIDAYFKALGQNPGEVRRLVTLLGPLVLERDAFKFNLRLQILAFAHTPSGKYNLTPDHTFMCTLFTPVTRPR
jgi:hypothetical protein